MGVRRVCLRPIFPHLRLWIMELHVLLNVIRNSTFYVWVNYKWRHGEGTRRVKDFLTIVIRPLNKNATKGDYALKWPLIVWRHLLTCPWQTFFATSHLFISCFSLLLLAHISILYAWCTSILRKRFLQKKIRIVFLQGPRDSKIKKDG